MGNSVLFTTIIILFLIFLLVFLKVLYMYTCKNTLTESFDEGEGIARGKKNCSNLTYIDNCENADPCHQYWSEVPSKAPSDDGGNSMLDQGEPMACNYDGGGRDSEGKCTFKVNKVKSDGSGGNKVNDKWMCEPGTAHKHSAVEDDCGVPNGDNTTCADECGVPNGDNTTCADDCGVPNGDNSTCAVTAAAAATTTTATTTTATAAPTTCPECVCDTSSLDNEINDLRLEITNLRKQISFMQNTER